MVESRLVSMRDVGFCNLDLRSLAVVVEDDDAGAGVAPTVVFLDLGASKLSLSLDLDNARFISAAERRLECLEDRLLFLDVLLCSPSVSVEGEVDAFDADFVLDVWTFLDSLDSRRLLLRVTGGSEISTIGAAASSGISMGSISSDFFGLRRLVGEELFSDDDSSL